MRIISIRSRLLLTFGLGGRTLPLAVDVTKASIEGIVHGATDALGYHAVQGLAARFMICGRPCSTCWAWTTSHSPTALGGRDFRLAIMHSRVVRPVLS